MTSIRPPNRGLVSLPQGPVILEPNPDERGLAIPQWELKWRDVGRGTDYGLAPDIDRSVEYGGDNVPNWVNKSRQARAIVTGQTTVGLRDDPEVREVMSWLDWFNANILGTPADDDALTYGDALNNPGLWDNVNPRPSGRYGRVVTSTEGDVGKTGGNALVGIAALLGLFLL
jgi:hypothetical protein